MKKKTKILVEKKKKRIPVPKKPPKVEPISSKYNRNKAKEILKKSEDE